MKPTPPLRGVNELLPIGPLMAEHRLIERMVRLIRAELERIEETNSLESGFLNNLINFLRTYADRCHHGKEENILFRELSKKELSQDHRTIMQMLIDDHTRARKTVQSLELAKEDYVRGNTEAFGDIVKLLGNLVELYPRHIEAEDRSFFYPCMEYFSGQEQEEMVGMFWEFDRKLIHEMYKGIVERMEKSGYEMMAKWRCKICGYVYDPEAGDPDGGVKPGTPFEDIPADWRCPICNAPKTEFEKMA